MKKLLALGAILMLSILATGCGKNDNAWFNPDPDFQPTPEMEEMAKMAQ